MTYSTRCRQYWGKAIDALALVYAYKKAGTDEFEYQIRAQEFPDAINQLCNAYCACNLPPCATFEMVDDEIDLFFHELVMNPKLLKKIYRRAIDYFNVAAPAISLRTLCAEIRQEIK